MRALGLDLGSKTLGIAITDSQKIIATGIENFTYENNNLKKCIDKIKTIFQQYQDIDTIVLGYVKYKSGDKSSQSYLTEKFMQLLKQNFYSNLKYVFHDESYSTINTISLMKEAGLKGSKIRKIKDKMSAVYILQDWLATNHEKKQ